MTSHNVYFALLVEIGEGRVAVGGVCIVLVKTPRSSSLTTSIAVFTIVKCTPTIRDRSICNTST